MPSFINFAIPGIHHRPIVADLVYRPDGQKKPLVVFVHGYKGFKDWGVFGRMDDEFVTEGFALLKFNFSHNGGTLQDPIDFPDLEAFGRNNYSMELDDLNAVMDWLHAPSVHSNEINLEAISLMGHSRGGAMATLTAANDHRVSRLVTWASVSTLNRTCFAPGPERDAWKKNGVMYVKNGRTQQLMPHGFQWYEDYQANQERFDVEAAARNLRIPHLIAHGDADESVPLWHAQLLKEWSAKSELLTVSNADHVFGGKHPWTDPDLPQGFQKVLARTLTFLNSTLDR